MKHLRPTGPHMFEHASLRSHDTTQGPATVRWRINGYPASLLIWSREEWERLPVRPVDAQLHPLGLWCALRVD